VLFVTPTEVLSHPIGASAGEASQADLSTAVLTIPAPIVADPSVPDPVPGDSFPASPVIIDSPDASGISVIPLSFQRVYDLDGCQLSSGTSGLFTPAQRSDGGTSVLLEDEAAEASTSLHNGAKQSPAIPSTPPQAHAERASTEHPTVVEEDGGRNENGDVAWVDNIIQSSKSPPSNERHLGVEAVDVDAQNPAVDAVQVDDNISTPLDRSAKLILSPLHKVDNILTKDISPGIPFKESPEHPDLKAANGERLSGAPKVVEDDEDADGEADPDYSPVNGVVEEVNLSNAHQPVDEEGGVAYSKVSNDNPGSTEVAQELETLPTR
jgi:hypothetical protein